MFDRIGFKQIVYCCDFYFKNQVISVCTMGRRKLKFIMRKNYERKKYAAKALIENIETPPDFTIRIARTIYSAAMAGPCSSIDMLHRRLLSSPEFTPSGWESSLSDLLILLRKSIESMTFLVKVESDFSFQITVGDYAISNLSYFVAVKLECACSHQSTGEVCGQTNLYRKPDEQFDQTRLRRSGIVNDQTGKVAHSI